MSYWILLWVSFSAFADNAPPEAPVEQPSTGTEKKVKILYPKKTQIDLEGMSIEGEMRTPGDFYFLHRKPEKMDSLVKRRKNFHREMLRDAVSGY